jgi:hypothetical protein
MRLSSDEQNGSITLKFMTLLQCGRSLWATGLFRTQYAPNPADEPWPLSAEELPRGVRRVRSRSPTFDPAAAARVRHRRQN